LPAKATAGCVLEQPLSGRLKMIEADDLAIARAQRCSPSQRRCAVPLRVSAAFAAPQAISTSGFFRRSGALRSARDKIQAG
jgi:hypothetical protein